MPQTFTQLHYHLVFSTRHREPTITPDIRPRVWEYLGGIVRGEGGISIQVGGTADHVHLLATLNQNHSLAEFMRKLKANSRVGYTARSRRVVSGGRPGTARSPSATRPSMWCASTSPTRNTTTARCHSWMSFSDY